MSGAKKFLRGVYGSARTHHVGRKKGPRGTMEVMGGYTVDLDRGGSLVRQTLPAHVPGKDYGYDLVGDGTFRMVPSGDVVSLEEMRRRLPQPKIRSHLSKPRKVRKKTHHVGKKKPALRIAYRLQLSPSEMRALEMVRGRYSWPDMLAAHASEGGAVAFTEPEMWQWTDDVDSDAEGGHSPFPMASGAFAAKLQRFYDERI